MARRGEGKGGDEAKDKQKTPRIRPIGHQVHPDGYMSCPNLFFMWDTKYIRIAWLSESQAMMLALRFGCTGSWKPHTPVETDG